MCETWCTNKPNPTQLNKFKIIDSPAVRKAIKGRASGGLMIALNNKIYKNAESLYNTDNYIIIKFNYLNVNIILCTVYINQTNNLEIILSNLTETLDQIKLKFPNVNIVINDCLR